MGKELGQKILSAIRLKGISQKELAAMIGVTEGVISRYISGEREPKPEMIANIATALHTTSDYLLGIEKDDFDYPRVCRMIARNGSCMTEAEKKELINALFGEE